MDRPPHGDVNGQTGEERRLLLNSLPPEDDVEILEDKQQSSLPASIFNLSNTIIGSGTLAMPFVCKSMGIGFFVIFLIVFGLISDYCLWLLSETVRKMDIRHARYPMLGRTMFGTPGYLVANLSVTFQQLGACTAYVVIVGDLLQPILQEFVDPHGTAKGFAHFVTQRVTVQIFILVVVIFPLCMLRRIDSLKFVSLASLCLIVSFVAVLCTNGIRVAADPSLRKMFNPDAGHQLDVFAIPNWSDFLASLPIVSFSFLCHQNAFPIIDELKNPTPRRMGVVSHTSIMICGLAYVAAGILGYVTFVDQTLPNILKNYQVSGAPTFIIMDVVRMGFGISFCLTYPLVVWEARHGIHDAVFGDRPYSLMRYFCLNLCIIGFTGTIGVLVPEITTVLGFIGSTCSPTMVFVLPPLFFIRASREPAFSKHQILARLTLAFGLVLIPVSFTTTIMSLSNGD